MVELFYYIKKKKSTTTINMLCYGELLYEIKKYNKKKSLGN